MPLTTCPDCNRQVSTRAAACPSCGCPIGGAASVGPAPPSSSAFRAATCPQCEGQVPTAAGARRAICPYCQCELHLDVGGGGPEVTNLITLAQSAYASGNFEESLNYANKALELDAHNPMVWLGKALATANLSTLQHRRFTEMEDLLRRGLQFATDDQSAWAVRQQAAAAISVFGPSFFEAARRAYVAFQGPGSLAVFVEQCVEVVQMLRLAAWCDPTNRRVLEEGARIAFYAQDALVMGATPAAAALFNTALQEFQGRLAQMPPR